MKKVRLNIQKLFGWAQSLVDWTVEHEQKSKVEEKRLW